MYGIGRRWITYTAEVAYTSSQKRRCFVIRFHVVFSIVLANVLFFSTRSSVDFDRFLPGGTSPPLTATLSLPPLFFSQGPAMIVFSRLSNSWGSWKAGGAHKALRLDLTAARSSPITDTLSLDRKGSRNSGPP